MPMPTFTPSTHQLFSTIAISRNDLSTTISYPSEHSNGVRGYRFTTVLHCSFPSRPSLTIVQFKATRRTLCRESLGFSLGCAMRLGHYQRMANVAAQPSQSAGSEPLRCSLVRWWCLRKEAVPTRLAHSRWFPLTCSSTCAIRNQLVSYDYTV
jgi:hypothetical protein